MMTKLDEVDVCIIGSGAGGGLAAKELGENGICVVVLEAGKRFNPLHDFCGATQRDWERALEDQRQIFRVPKMDRVTIASKDTHRPSVAYGVGGTTLRYLAYCPRLLPDDFSIRSHDGVGMDWPITYEELAPYYRKVEWELGVSGAGADPWFPDIEKYPNPPFEFSYTNKIVKRGCDKLGIRLWPVPVARNSRPFDGRPTCVQCGECEYGCMTGARGSVDVTYIPKAEATGKVQIRPECVVTRIETDANGKAKSVVYFDKNGMEYEQKAKIIIVSAGTVQTPRLLLNSKSSQHPDGLANSSGMVGRNWMQHISLFSAAVFPDRIDSYRGFFGGAISLDRAGTNKKNSFVRGWSLELNSGIRGPAQLALSVPGWGASHKKYLHRVFGHIAGIVTVGEQLPDERNRVELDPEVVDHYGMPVPRITWGEDIIWAPAAWVNHQKLRYVTVFVNATMCQIYFLLMVVFLCLVVPQILHLLFKLLGHAQSGI
jgi:choline dehydrogenase-like flavoprotein